jgi:hypothetical protein
MMTGKPGWLPLVFCLLCVTADGQEMKLEPGNPVERQIAGGESHSYKISLTAGQFARFRLEQRAIVTGAPGSGVRFAIFRSSPMR